MGSEGGGGAANEIFFRDCGYVVFKFRGLQGTGEPGLPPVWGLLLVWGLGVPGLLAWVLDLKVQSQLLRVLDPISLNSFSPPH